MFDKCVTTIERHGIKNNMISKPSTVEPSGKQPA